MDFLEGSVRKAAWFSFMLYFMPSEILGYWNYFSSCTLVDRDMSDIYFLLINHITIC